MPYSGIICQLVVWAKIVVMEPENGKYNHYLELFRPMTKECQVTTDNKDKNKVPVGGFHVGVSASQWDVRLGEEGEFIKIRLDADCFRAFGVDEAATEKMNQWISYRSWLCDATKIEVLGK
ncbi:MAG: hypothetical protein QXL01_00430 [Thermoplasmatales archaeon]